MKPVWIKWLSGFGTLATFAFYLNFTQPDVKADNPLPENMSANDKDLSLSESSTASYLLKKAERIEDLELELELEHELEENEATSVRKKMVSTTAPKSNQKKTTVKKNALEQLIAEVEKQEATDIDEEDDDQIIVVEPDPTPTPVPETDAMTLDEWLANQALDQSNIQTDEQAVQSTRRWKTSRS